MLVLALDTSTPAVTVGVVEVEACGRVRTLATRVTVNARAHTEVCSPHIAECLRETGVAADRLDAVVVGIGPGPFTGLRVGMATGAAFADALGIPAYGVCSLDGIAAAAGTDEDLLVVTDARRREVYWARYGGGIRVAGPFVSSPDDLDVGTSTVAAGSVAHANRYGLPLLGVESPTPDGLVAAADFSTVPASLEPMYLRRPDAVEQARK